MRRKQPNVAAPEPIVLTASHTRPVAGLMDRLGHLSFEQLLNEKQRLEKARRGRGIGPDEWYRLHAVKALITRHEVEHLRRTTWTVEAAD
jgi:hypothetical protein